MVRHELIVEGLGSAKDLAKKFAATVASSMAVEFTSNKIMGAFRSNANREMAKVEVALLAAVVWTRLFGWRSTWRAALRLDRAEALKCLDASEFFLAALARKSKRIGWLRNPRDYRKN